jgi:hypothetical protein
MNRLKPLSKNRFHHWVELWDRAWALSFGIGLWDSTKCDRFSISHWWGTTDSISFNQPDLETERAYGQLDSNKLALEPGISLKCDCSATVPTTLSRISKLWHSDGKKLTQAHRQRENQQVSVHGRGSLYSVQQGSVFKLTFGFGTCRVERPWISQTQSAN